MKAPTTLKELLQIAKKPLWLGKAYCSTAITNVEAFITCVGDLPLKDVKTIHIDAFVDSMEGVLKDSTINRKLTNVHSVLKYAMDRDWINKMPKVTWKSEDNSRVRWISEKEEETMLTLLESWGEHEIARFITVLLDTGMRRGELLNLKEKDVDGDWIRLWVSKTKGARSIPLSERAKACLTKGMFDVNLGHLRSVWSRLKDSMGLQGDADFVLHTLRHTAATRTLAKTKNVVVVQKLLGHKNVKTTLRYAHLSDDELLAAVR
jgi:integrase